MGTTTAAIMVTTIDTKQEQAIDTYQVWCSVLAILRKQVPEPVFRTWLEGTRLYTLEETRAPVTKVAKIAKVANVANTTKAAGVTMATVTVPSAFAAEWLQRRYSVLITQALEKCLGHRVSIQFKVEAVRSHRAIHALDGIIDIGHQDGMWFVARQPEPLFLSSQVSQVSSAAWNMERPPTRAEEIQMYSGAQGVQTGNNATQQQACEARAGQDVQGNLDKQTLQDDREVQTPRNANQHASVLPAPTILVPRMAPAIHRPVVQPPLSHTQPIPALNPRHTFDRFLVGRGNQLAASMAHSVAEAPGAAYNPLFIYGLRGVGKTHLLQAIGHDAHTRVGARVLFASALQFHDHGACFRFASLPSLATNDMIMGCDLLLVDDLHLIAGGSGRSAQQSLEALVEGMLAAGKGVVVTATQPPDAMLALHETLRFRLRGGMVVAIEPPDFRLQTRMVQQLADEWGVPVAEGAMEMIASAGQSLAEVLAAWKQACARAVQEVGEWEEGNSHESTTGIMRAASASVLPMDTISRRAISTQDVQSVLAARQPQLHIRPETIIDQVSAYFDLEANELSSPSRERRVMMPRHIAMYLIREETAASYEWIAHRFGRQDHTTAMYACARIEELMETDLEVRQTVLELRQMVYGEQCPCQYQYQCCEYVEDQACQGTLVPTPRRPPEALCGL